MCGLHPLSLWQVGSNLPTQPQHSEVRIGSGSGPCDLVGNNMRMKWCSMPSLISSFLFKCEDDRWIALTVFAWLCQEVRSSRVFINLCAYWLWVLPKSKLWWKWLPDLPRLFAKLTFAVGSGSNSHFVPEKARINACYTTGCAWFSHAGYCFADSSIWVYFDFVYQSLQQIDAIFQGVVISRWWGSFYACQEVLVTMGFL